MTSSSPGWRSLNHLKGHLRPQRIARNMFCSNFLFLRSHRLGESIDSVVLGLIMMPNSKKKHPCVDGTRVDPKHTSWASRVC